MPYFMEQEGLGNLTNLVLANLVDGKLYFAKLIKLVKINGLHFVPVSLTTNWLTSGIQPAMKPELIF